jgi:hypothetical protein
MKKGGIKNFNIVRGVASNHIYRFFTFHYILDLKKLSRQIIFIQMIIFLYNNNYK